jgi:hypothetical protein
VPALIVRVLFNFYVGNFVRVQWSGDVSDYFLAGNSVKQGGVLSPILFCLSIEGLLAALSTKGWRWVLRTQQFSNQFIVLICE